MAEVPCATTPAVPHNVGGGNNNDYSASVNGSISSATGSFDAVTGATGEFYTLKGNGNFSSQINTKPFSSSLCDNSNCSAEQQWVYDSPGNVYIQYWLRYHGSTCPTQTVAKNSWVYYNGSNGGAPGCYVNGNQDFGANSADLKIAWAAPDRQ